MDNIPLVLLSVYFVAILYITCYSLLYLRRTKQARIYTGMELPDKVVKVTKAVPLLSMFLLGIILLFLLAELLSLFNSLSG